MFVTGQFLVERIQKEGPKTGLRLAFVWNRNSDKLKDSVPEELILHNLLEFPKRYNAHTYSKSVCVIER